MPPKLTTTEVLDRMHAAILAADFATLAALTPDLESSLQSLESGGQAGLLRAVQAKAERNAACLLAAGRGIRAAQRRLKDLQNIGQGFSTYDGRGKREQHGQATSFALRY